MAMVHRLSYHRLLVLHRSMVVSTMTSIITPFSRSVRILCSSYPIGKTQNNTHHYDFREGSLKIQRK